MGGRRTQVAALDARKVKQQKQYQHLCHTLDPVFDSASKILILGTFPSVKSREGNFYYHHPRNRFWNIIAAITQEPIPKTIEEKRQLLLRHHIAIWDVIASCDMIGSSDSSIKNVIPADISWLLSAAPIEHILTNGQKAYRLYQTYCYPMTKKEAILCPSTSPANASYSFEKLLASWKTAI